MCDIAVGVITWITPFKMALTGNQRVLKMSQTVHTSETLIPAYQAIWCHRNQMTIKSCYMRYWISTVRFTFRNEIFNSTSDSVLHLWTEMIQEYFVHISCQTANVWKVTIQNNTIHEHLRVFQLPHNFSSIWPPPEIFLGAWIEELYDWLVFFTQWNMW